ncbi:hypothetical protein PanWU01x14_010420 [Parasponia andersonii]|uniref:Uncharacterized protein n=1 Tax=Parasponia andersonii TaxID=3476 RepID=A0A2P5E2R6_PARAD|nr:hypothetical protein PanWU01x14_010420 [Parasponia andersonii]
MRCQPHIFLSLTHSNTPVILSANSRHLISVLFLHNRTTTDLHSSICSTFTATQSHVYGSPCSRTSAAQGTFSVGGCVLINIADSAEALCPSAWLFGNKDNPHTKTDEMEELIKNIMELSMEDENSTAKASPDPRQSLVPRKTRKDFLPPGC